jgi:hypothetical protein
MTFVFGDARWFSIRLQKTSKSEETTGNGAHSGDGSGGSSASLGGAGSAGGLGSSSSDGAASRLPDGRLLRSDGGRGAGVGSKD